MKLYKRVLKLHQFRNLGKNLPTELLLNSNFEKHGGLVILVGENNVGKSNILEALKAFNDTDIKLCNENDYFKTHESKEATLSLEEETIRNNETIDFSCVDLKQTKKIGEDLKELSKTLIVYPFEKHIEALREQCSNIAYIPSNNNDYSNICTFVSNFKNLINSYNQLKPFLHFYKELIKHLSGNSEWIKTFCQCIKEIIKHNTPNKECNSDDFFVMEKHKQNQLSKIYSRFKKLSENEIKTKDVEYISKKIKSLDEIFKTTDFNTKFAPRIKILQNEQSQERLSEFIEDIIKEIDEKYPINENFKQQFRTFRSNVISIKKKIKNSLKDLDKTRKDFERKKESLIREIEDYCKNQKTPKFNYDVLLDNIQQICKEYAASHVASDVSKDKKYMICKICLNQIDLLWNPKIKLYKHSELLKSAEKSLWESIKILDNESGVHLFPKNIDEIKEKFEANKEKFKQSKNYSEFAEYCRECNPYTAFQDLRNRVNFPLKDHSLDKFVPTMKEYKELKITDNDLKTALFTGLNYSSPSEFESDWFFGNSLFRKMDFHPNTIWNTFGKILNYKNFDQKNLKYEQALEIMFDKNNDLEVYSGLDKPFVIPKKYLQEINQESLKEIKQSKYPFNIEAKGECNNNNNNNNIWQLEFFNDKNSLLFKINFTEILENIAEIMEYNMQLKMDSLIAKEFNKLLAIAQDDHQDNYQLKIHVRYNSKFLREYKLKAYEIKLEIYDCRKSHEQVVLKKQSTGFQWAFNFMFGFLYNAESNFSFNKNIIYVMDEPATPLSVPGRRGFRKLLKEYAHKHNVTFVLATHDPFLVDTDHLDEIRIVEKETEGSAIENNFNYPLNNASKDSDALDKIKRSLGVSQNVFHNPQKHRIVFVEGTTDYCYLSAFKLYFNEREFKNDPIPFTFLPISGLKDNQTDMQKTIQKLRKLDNNPIVLIDDDRKPNLDPQNAKSEQFKKANEEMHDPITILQLSSCDENFKQIEDYFSANDKEEYAQNKHMELAMAFKTRLLYSGKDDVVDEETKNNFKKLFEWIVWITNLIKC
ncbi:ATP-binding protein [Helicobacter pylori]|uniref:ATP-binding protein n=1 Tax=Helicobacter pylori TaxID=210 RepID=UPI0019203DB9|nr:ATP-binding protein [Helicobacter pylori]QQW65671.1 ATP-binding protein [Helicobacter pylori]